MNRAIAWLRGKRPLKSQQTYGRKKSRHSSPEQAGSDGEATPDSAAAKEVATEKRKQVSTSSDNTPAWLKATFHSTLTSKKKAATSSAAPTNATGAAAAANKSPGSPTANTTKQRRHLGSPNAHKRCNGPNCTATPAKACDKGMCGNCCKAKTETACQRHGVVALAAKQKHLKAEQSPQTVIGCALPPHMQNMGNNGGAVGNGHGNAKHSEAAPQKRGANAKLQAMTADNPLFWLDKCLNCPVRLRYEPKVPRRRFCLCTFFSFCYCNMLVALYTLSRPNERKLLGMLQGALDISE